MAAEARVKTADARKTMARIRRSPASAFDVMVTGVGFAIELLDEEPMLMEPAPPLTAIGYQYIRSIANAINP